MATIVSTRDAEVHIADLVERALGGEEIVIEGAGNRAVKLTPVPAEPLPEKRPLRFGTARGKIWISEDFNEPLPDDLLDLFEGKGDPLPEA